jgi:hypothetical protein
MNDKPSKLTSFTGRETSPVFRTHGFPKFKSQSAWGRWVTMPRRKVPVAESSQIDPMPSMPTEIV